MANYVDADKLKEEIQRFSSTEYNDNTIGDDIANGALDYVLEVIDTLQEQAKEEYIARNKEHEEASRQYWNYVIGVINKRVFPTFKGQTLHSFKNELHTMKQIMGLNNHPEIPERLVDKLALVFATWGGYHFHPKEIKSENTLQKQEVDCGEDNTDYSKEYVGVMQSPLKTFPRINEFECDSSYRH